MITVSTIFAANFCELDRFGRSYTEAVLDTCFSAQLGSVLRAIFIFQILCYYMCDPSRCHAVSSALGVQMTLQ